MAKKLRGPQMILSNRLDDGRVIFMKADGSWSVVPEDGAVADTDEGVAELLNLAQVAADDNFIVAPEVVEAKPSETGEGYTPSHIKHAMQTRGPSVRPDLGYQVSVDWEA